MVAIMESIRQLKGSNTALFARFREMEAEREKGDANHEIWKAENEIWKANDEIWKAENEIWKAENKIWKAENQIRRAENEAWRAEDDDWKAEKGKLWAEISETKAEDGERREWLKQCEEWKMTADRKRRALFLGNLTSRAFAKILTILPSFSPGGIEQAARTISDEDLRLLGLTSASRWFIENLYQVSSTASMLLVSDRRTDASRSCCRSEGLGMRAHKGWTRHSLD